MNKFQCDDCDEWKDKSECLRNDEAIWWGAEEQLICESCRDERIFKQYG